MAKGFRNYATIVYDESSPAGWLDVLNDLHIPAFVSPLHNCDVNKDGEIKKAHWHVLLMFAGQKTEDSAKRIVESFGGVGLEKIHDLKAYARYLCHLDDDDKAQYSIDDVLAFGGADYQKYSIKDREKDVVLGEIVDFILDNEGSCSFAYIVKYARFNKPDWFKALVSSGSAYLIKEFLNSVIASGSDYDRKSFSNDTEGINEVFENGGVIDD